MEDVERKRKKKFANGEFDPRKQMRTTGFNAALLLLFPVNEAHQNSN